MSSKINLSFNIKKLIVNFVIPEKICKTCINNSKVFKSVIELSKMFKTNSKLIQCDYHHFEKKFESFLINCKKNCTDIDLFDLGISLNNNQGNIFSYHNSKVNKIDFKSVVERLLNNHKVKSYHFCCNNTGVMFTF
tara:strand:- start:162 stop:569 length:408 start_codon:yes stop_codon:yes gene_type:complete